MIDLTTLTDAEFTDHERAVPDGAAADHFDYLPEED